MSCGDENGSAHKSGCLVCGADIRYLPVPEEHTCVYCGETHRTTATCTKGHYICDTCHRSGAESLIETFCAQAAGKDPVEMANTLMRHPTIRMHGPEHHLLVPAVLVAAWSNYRGEEAMRAVRVREAVRRGGDMKGGSCGFLGACGAAVGVGIFVSVVTGTTPLTTLTWQQANLATAEALRVIALNGGPRCCKRNTFLALISASDFSATHLGTAIPASHGITCHYSPLNRECRKEACPFHPSS